MRTNPGLTTNVKIVVDSLYGLSMDSINTNSDLSLSRYKKRTFNKSNYLDELIPYFYDGLPAEIAFDIKYDNDSDTSTTNFADQYDEIYQYGARNIVDNKNYSEEYEYFAPLYLFKNKLPKGFMIFRVDGPGMINLTKENFKSEILDKMKAISYFDLTKKTPLGEWLDLNINDNRFFPETPLEINFDRMEFSRWNGINYAAGGYVSKSMIMYTELEEEKEIFGMEKQIFDGYKNNKVVFPNILNFSFLFDDTPADENSLRKWSINRYYGFYVDDMEKIASISPYSAPALRTDVVVKEGNILYSDSGDPFLDGWKDGIPFYVEYKNDYYRVERFEVEVSEGISGVSNSNKKQGSLMDVNDPLAATYKTDQKVVNKESRWRIISDLDLSGMGDMLNGNIGYIGEGKVVYLQDGTPFDIDGFDMYDMCVVEIDGKYHSLKRNSSGNICLITDYSFSFSQNKYSYYVNKQDSNMTKVVSTLVDENNSPKSFSIFRLKLSDIKDFDTRIVETETSRFEYEEESDITITREPKLYVTDLNSTTNPMRLDGVYYKGDFVHIPASSEYTSNNELFKIDEGVLSPIWRKNSIHCRWCYQGSISNADQPYILNNSLVFDDFNMTTDTLEDFPNRESRNLDYFYTINSDSDKYTHHSLHIQKSISGGVDKSFDFDLERYLGMDRYLIGTASKNVDYDYFTSFFTLKSTFNKGKLIKNTKKYSEFLPGDSQIPNVTLFRGIKFSIYDIGNISMLGGRIDSITTRTSNRFEDYKFSVLLTSKDNGMQWMPITNWAIDQKYKKGEMVVSDNTIYVAQRDTSCNIPLVGLSRLSRESGRESLNLEYVQSGPRILLDYGTTLVTQIPGTTLKVFNANTYATLLPGAGANKSSDWKVYEDPYSIIWNPLKTIKGGTDEYKPGDYVHYFGNYYVYKGSSNGSIDFWNPILASRVESMSTNPNRVGISGYGIGSIVRFNDEFYKSKIDSNIHPPKNKQYWEVVENQFEYFKWSIVPLWTPTSQYPKESFVQHSGMLYKSINVVPSNQIPTVSPLWSRIYNMTPNTTYAYQKDGNPIIRNNGIYYKIISNPKNNTLDNGIKVYINHKYKNILINIFINDNTSSYTRDSKRDDMYTNINKKLTAKSFIERINNPTSRGEFSDHLEYVVIEKNGTINRYSYTNKFTNLPFLILAEGPEYFDVKISSLYFLPVNDNKIKAKKYLTDSNITNISQLNHFNGTNIASEIIPDKSYPNLKTYNGNSPSNYKPIYRFGGNYMPLFTDIDLFNVSNVVQYRKISTKLDVNVAQNVVFEFAYSGKTYQRTRFIYPGASYSTISGFYSQISAIVQEEFPNIDFRYKISAPKRTYPTDAILNLNQDSYNIQLKKWFDISGQGNFADNSSSIYCTFSTSDIYPGNHINIGGLAANRSILEVDEMDVNAPFTLETIVYTGDVTSERYFFGDGNTKFGFKDGRAFMYLKFDVSGVPTEKKIFTTDTLMPNTWYHLVFTLYSVSSVYYAKIYVDTQDRTHYDSPSTIPSNGIANNPYLGKSKFAIGASNILPIADISSFKGKIASVRFYDKSLTQGQITESFKKEHGTFDIYYKDTLPYIKMTLLPIYPSLVMDIIDYFDPLLPSYDLILGATGGNPPYQWSYNGGAFSTTSLIPDVPKSSNVTVIVKDSIGMTSSSGYYIINSSPDIKKEVKGGFIYS